MKKGGTSEISQRDLWQNPEQVPRPHTHGGDCGVWWLQELARESCISVSAEQLNFLTLQMSHLDSID